MKVLLVEDDELFLKVVQHLLIKKGYEVKTAMDVTTGLEEALEAQPDIIISDYELPDGTGLELFEELEVKGLLPHTKRVLMSEHAMNFTKPIWQAYDDGKISEFVQKQFIVSNFQTTFNYF